MEGARKIPVEVTIEVSTYLTYLAIGNLAQMGVSLNRPIKGEC